MLAAPIYQSVIASAGLALLIITATGMLVRSRATYCWTFVVYLLATASFQSLIIWWPERFLVFTFYFVKETMLVLLKIGIAIEIWRRSFSTFPQARIRTGVLLTSVLALMAAASQIVPDDLQPYDVVMGVILPRLQAGIVLLYSVVVCAIGWYRVPVHPTHRAILLGFAGYLSVHAVLLSLNGWRPSTYQWVSPVNAAIYVLTEIWWCWAAWRPLREPTPMVLRLQPWARSW